MVGLVISYSRISFSFLIYSLNLRPQVPWGLALDVGFWVFFIWKLSRFAFVEAYTLWLSEEMLECSYILHNF